MLSLHAFSLLVYKCIVYSEAFYTYLLRSYVMSVLHIYVCIHVLIYLLLPVFNSKLDVDFDDTIFVFVKHN
jgi:hypothetical protein